MEDELGTLVKSCAKVGLSSAKRAFERFVMFLWRVVRWLIPRFAVIFSIAFAVAWGGIFQSHVSWLKCIGSWAAIWAAIEYYKWHTIRYET